MMVSLEEKKTMSKEEQEKWKKQVEEKYSRSVTKKTKELEKRDKENKGIGKDSFL